MSLRRGGSSPLTDIDKLFGLPYNLSHRGVSSAVERYPSKLDVVGSIPILRFGDYSPNFPPFHLFYGIF